MAKTISTRVPNDLAQELDEVATYDGVAVSQLVREGIESVLASRKLDPEFRQRVLEFANRTHARLESIGADEAAGGYYVSDEIRVDLKENLNRGLAARAHPSPTLSRGA